MSNPYPCQWCGVPVDECGDPDNRCCDLDDHPFPTIAATLAALHDDIFHADEAALLRADTSRDGGTETQCPLEGVHEHAFRGPHRFREWEPGT